MDPTKKNIWVEIFGWYGVVALLLAYALISFEFVDSSSILFHFLNATGACGIVVDALFQKNWQPAVLNTIWAIVALVSIIKLLQ